MREGSNPLAARLDRIITESRPCRTPSKPPPDHPAIAYLVQLHADIGGRIQANKVEAERLAADMMAVQSVIKIFNPDYNVTAIAVRRRQRTNPWFRRGTLFREALEVLRKAGGPMTVREITDAVLAAKGIPDAPP